MGQDWRSCCGPRPVRWLSQSLNSPKGNTLIRTSFASPGAAGLLFFALQLSKLPRHGIEAVPRVFTLRISQQFSLLFPFLFLFTEGIADFTRLAFEEFTMCFSARWSAVQSFSSQSFSVSSSVLIHWLFIYLRTGDHLRLVDKLNWILYAIVLNCSAREFAAKCRLRRRME